MMKRIAALLFAVALVCGQASAGFLLNSFAVATYPSLYVGGGSATTTAASTHTYSSLDIGAAPTDGDRVVVACFGAGGSSRTVSSMTIGGVSATIHYGRTNSGADWNGNSNIACGYATVNSGTTATVSIVWSASISQVGCQVYSLYNLTSTTAANTGNNNAASTTTVSATATVQTFGITIAAGMQANSSSPSITTDTSDFSATRSTVQGMAVGHKEQGSSGNTSESMTFTGGSNANRAIVYLHFR